MSGSEAPGNVLRTAPKLYGRQGFEAVEAGVLRELFGSGGATTRVKRLG